MATGIMQNRFGLMFLHKTGALMLLKENMKEDCWVIFI